MKVYVDRLPKCCEECPCCNNCMDYGCSCNLDDIKLTYDDYANKRHKNCLLQSLSDYTKQVRKEICDKIRKEFEPSNATKIDENVCTPTNESMLVANGFKSCKRRLFKKLDEIQG